MPSFVDQFVALRTRLEGLAGAAIFPAIVYAGSRVVLTWGAKLHWIVGGLFASLLGVVVALLLFGLTDTFFKQFSASVVLSLFASVVLLAANVCSTLSYILLTRGLASYESPCELHPGVFADLYHWHLIDMIPGFKVWETLRVQAPVKAKGLLASLPILMFRVCVGLPILAFFIKWYKQVK